MKVVFFTGAGISAESGIQTFRGADGLWEGKDPQVMAHIDTWNSSYNRKSKREDMLEFYNQRRAQLKEVEPNAAHNLIGELEKHPGFDVTVITQNVDDLHERGGATKVVHLHGSLKESKGTLDSKLIYPCEGDLNIGDKCEKGSQLRPNIVWFGENVPLLYTAMDLIDEADVVISVGTSGVVEPAASLFKNTNNDKILKYIVNPVVPGKDLYELENVKVFEENASTGVKKVIEELINLKK